MRDLLVIAGPNSGGKSTIIQALLLLAQTLDNPKSDVVLDLGGKYVQFSEFREAVFGRPPASKARFSVGFEVDLVEPNLGTIQGVNQLHSRVLGGHRQTEGSKGVSDVLNRVSLEIEFGADKLGSPVVKNAAFQKDFSSLGKVKMTYHRHGERYRVTKEIIPKQKRKTSVSHEEVQEQLLQKFRKFFSKSEAGQPSSLRFFWEDYFFQPLNAAGFALYEIPVVGPELLRMAERFSFSASSSREKLAEFCSLAINYCFEVGLKGSTIYEARFDHFLTPFLVGKTKETGKSTASSLRINDIHQGVFGAASSGVKEWLLKLRYIGPLRAKPERAYLSLGTPVDIGNSGENAVPLLWLFQNEKIANKTVLGGPQREVRLVEAVQDWLKEFGLGSEFRITKPKRVIYQAELASSPGSKTMVTIADVGFGMSQILPVIVAGLRAPHSSTLVLEQPEIHLHPKLQGKLADFLLCLVELGKRVVVETHSEHLVNTLRLRIVQDQQNELQNHIGIIFVKNPRVGRGYKSSKTSSLENLKVDKYGRVINWPSDFFPEASTTDELILKAMIDKYPRQ